MLSLPRLGCQVLGADLNRSESARNAADTCRSAAALRDFNRVYVRFGSSADKATLKGSVRFTSKSRQTGDIPECPLSANSDRMHCSKQAGYSITSSARASSIGGTSKPSALAVLRLVSNSSFVDCSIGNSPGLAPLKILST